MPRKEFENIQRVPRYIYPHCLSKKKAISEIDSAVESISLQRNKRPAGKSTIYIAAGTYIYLLDFSSQFIGVSIISTVDYSFELLVLIKAVRNNKKIFEKLTNRSKANRPAEF